MSKSGVFAHFGSREELQISVIREYHAQFEEEVFFPAMREPRGLPRLRALFERWVQAGLGRDRLGLHLHQRRGRVRRPARARCATRWSTMVQDLAAGARARDRTLAVDEGHLRADTDATQMLFEIHGLILALHHDARFLRHAGADRPRPRRLRARARALRRRDAAPAARASAPLNPIRSFTGVHPCPIHPAPARHAVRDARAARRRRRAQGAAARMPTSTPTPSTRCSKKAASSPPRCWRRSTRSATPRAARSTRRRTRCKHAQGLQGGLRQVRRRRLAGARAATRRSAARACRSSSTSASSRC